MNSITALKKALLISLSCIALAGCSKKENDTPPSPAEDLVELKPVQKNHVWYYFNGSDFAQTDLPQHTPEVMERPWTESTRIASAASAPTGESKAYALVNRLGMLSFNGNEVKLHTDASIFSGVTADSLVFSEGKPVFYLYRSSFFNTDFENSVSAAVQPSRPFLVEFDSAANLFFPLVSYANLKLDDDQQIAGYFWDGKTWACSAKKTVDRRVEFSYFYWEPNAPITSLSPALSSSANFTFKSSTEEEYRTLNMPRLFNSAPEDLKDLVSSIPSEFSFSVVWKNSEGTSPVQYFQQGSGGVPLNANASSSEKYVAAVFADGTTYIQTRGEEEKNAAFRLPLLPAGYVYGDFAISGDTMYVAWEQSSFYKTGRTGFLQVQLAAVLSQF
ncbi:MAG TPA: hypothetical protein DCM57_04875 [Treponema sp.]|nr:hypothetical protein [Treponema sp.]